MGRETDPLAPEAELKVGCWEGTVDDLEKMVAGDDWPEARGEERERRRPGLVALVALCRAHIGLVAARSAGETGETEGGSHE